MSAELVTDALDELNRRGNGGLKLWRSQLLEASSSADFVEANASELVQLIFATQARYGDLRLQRAVSRVLRHALKVDTFLKLFTGNVVKAQGQKLGRQEAYLLLRWSGAVLRQLDVNAAKKAVSKLVECQSSFLEALYPQGSRWQVVTHVIERNIRIKPALMQHYIAVAAEQGSAPLVRIISSVCSKDPSLLAEHKGTLLNIYCTKVLASKEVLAPAVYDCYNGLLSTVTDEELRSQLLPAAIRSVKQRPEPALAAVTCMMQGLKVDLAPYATDFFAVFLQQSRHAKEPVRRAAVDAVRALVCQLSSAECLRELFTTASKLLDGSAEGKMKVVAERAGVATSICALASWKGRGRTIGQLSTDAVDFLCKYYQDENNEEVRLILTGGIGAFGSRCSTITDTLVPLLAAGLKEKDTLKKAHLRSLCQVLLGNPSHSAQFVSVLGALSKVVLEGVTKAVQRADGIAALLCASIVAAQEQAAVHTLAKEKVWSSTLKPDSPLFSAATCSKLAPEDGVLLAELCYWLVIHHSQQLDQSSGSTLAVIRCLVLLLLHHGAPTRAAAAQCVTNCLQAAPSLSGLFLSSLHHWMCIPPKELAPVVEVSTEDGFSRGLMAHRFLNALSLVTPPVDAPLTPPLLSQLLLMAHHPVISQYCRRPRDGWTGVKQKLGTAVGAVMAEDPFEVCNSLMGEGGASSSEEEVRSAAYLGLGSAMAVTHVVDGFVVLPQAFHAQLLPRLQSLLTRDDHDSLTPEEVKVYFTPEGKLSWEKDLESNFIPEVVESKNVRKARGRFKMDYGEEGAAGAAQTGSRANGSALTRKTSTSSLKGGPASKTAPKGGKPKDHQEAVRQQQLDKEAQVRAFVQSIKDRLSTGLHALAAAAAGNPSFTQQVLEDYSVLVIPLLSSPLVGEGSAFAAARQLASCLPPPMDRLGADTACALRMVALLETPGGQVGAYDIPSHPAVSSCVAAMASATKDGTPLPTPAYALCFPILKAVLSSPSHTPLHDTALAVVSLHVAPGMVVPREDTLGLLYHVLGLIPAFRSRVRPLLRDLCSGLTEEELPAALCGVTAPDSHVRSAALDALQAVPAMEEGAWPEEDELVVPLWLSCSDTDQSNAAAAQRLWHHGSCELPPTFVRPLMQYLGRGSREVRQAAAAALSRGLQEHLEAIAEALGLIMSCYAPPIGPPARRSGMALALQAIASQLSEADVPIALDFLLSRGLADDDEYVRAEMVAAGVSIVNVHGSTLAASLVPLLEGYLERSGVGDEAQYDMVREGAVIWMGTLAAHMDPNDEKVHSIVFTLIDVLRTPSEVVQRSVADCMTPLMARLSGDREQCTKAVAAILHMLVKGEKYGDRRGAAFGLAGVVKGLGLTALKGYGIMDTLKAGMENRTDANAREGALYAFEALSDKLGRLFEPYVIHILPMLLVAFGDSSPAVREAAESSARAIMAQLSAQGVKLVLPALLKGVEDRSWRSKQGSIQLLGAMAHCAPRQLSTCLPTVVPRLAEVLTDPHPKVQAAARTALSEVGSIIRNPEVHQLVPALMNAISDPNNHGKAALDVLLNTTFVNTIDAPSLALILPVVHRGLRDRSGDTKKRAAKIVGNMSSLINDPKDMAPYVPLLLPEIQSTLVDPLPEVRAVAAKALGSLFAGMGDEYFQQLMPWLLQTLKSEGSGVERSGAAAGLAEVLAVAGPAYVNALLPDIIDNCSSRNAFMREGSLTLFKFLPLTIPQEFQPHLSEVLPCILDGLADEAEGVRDAALAAGRTLVELYSATALPLLLPAVEAGLINDNWRIRQSSVELLGDLLFKVAGHTGKVQIDTSHDEDESHVSSEAHGAAIIQALGMERRNEIVAAIYIARSDVAYSVRTAALHVWKSLVSNTPKTLGECMTQIMHKVIFCLASEGEDTRSTAGRCLGELVRKMGDRVLGNIIPILQQGVHDDSAATRQGVCYGLMEVLDNVSRHQLADHLADLMPTVQTALTDDDPDVRQAAGAAFGILFKGGAGSVVDSIIPSLLLHLEGSDSHAAQALEGLRVIVGVKPNMLNAMVPKLIKPPLNSAHLRALGALAEVAGPAIHPHIHTVLPLMLGVCAQQEGQGNTLAAAAKEAMEKVALAVQEDGVYLLVAEVQKAVEDPSAAKRVAATQLINNWCRNTKLEYQEHIATFLMMLMPLFAEDDDEVLMSAWTAVSTITSSIPKELQPSFVRTLKDAVSTARDKQRRKLRSKTFLVPGFCLPKALAPVLPIYLQGVLQGTSADLRELSAEGLGELVEVTSPESLRPFTVQITGPLIRIMGDRFPWQIKAAILNTLGIIIHKAAANLKPFVPQLQTTFLKCLGDQAGPVRQKAANNLGSLSVLSARVDALATELTISARTADASIQESYLSALQGVLINSGSRLSHDTVTKAGEVLSSIMRNAGDDEGIREAVAGCLGAYAKLCSSEELKSLLASGPLGSATSVWHDRLGHVLVLTQVAKYAMDRLISLGLLKPSVDALVRYSRDDHEQIKIASARGVGYVVCAEASSPSVSSPSLPAFASVLVALLGPDQTSDVQRVALKVLRDIGNVNAAVLHPAWGVLLPSLCSLVSVTSGPIKATAERTLAKVLQMDKSQGADDAREFVSSGSGGGVVRQTLTESYLRRLTKLPAADDDDDAL